MSIFGVVNVVGTLLIIAVCFYIANRIVKNSQKREWELTNNGVVVSATILSMKQTGLFLNNNPVLELNLRVKSEKEQRTWLVEKHQETAMLIAVASYEVGGVYEARVGKNDNDILLVKDASGKPIRIE
ncbi:hypothetical protein PMPD1_0834 [Paramixta manurensis]|uniref:Uncharacterized protein n=1 Tax=Paramixta manurensis TaxID=2740817 RepID=A0A6M8U551_9GAMM|nr:hypothetical protein PMPD1_0834 [Erwiniaceae bacterium PD-1]